MYPELEIALSRRGHTSYGVVFRFRDANSAVEQRFEVSRIRIDVDSFESDLLLSDLPAYGLALGSALFSSAVARQAFDTAINVATVQQRSLRIRLCMDQRSLKLHRLRWELLLIPDAAEPANLSKAKSLASSENVLFSRHLFSNDMRLVKLRPRSDLSALIVVAAPTDTTKYRDGSGRPLPGIVLDGADGELTLAKQGLEGLRQTFLIPEAGVRVTLPRLLEVLRSAPDILYLACHGAIMDDEPQLLLENPDGTGAVVSGDELVEAFKGLRTLPRLVVLISCQSGGNAECVADDEPENPSVNVADAALNDDALDDESWGLGGKQAVLSALGPKLAEAGVAAVLAMQGDLDKATARKFLPPFFKKLNETGQVDEAVTAGRLAVRDSADAWVFVLYTRLVEGRVWFTKGLSAIGGQGNQGNIAWQQLAIDITRGKCVPILGPGLLEPFLGTTREIATRLAYSAGFPHGLQGGDDLPQVAQFLETMRGKTDPQVQIPVLTAMTEAVGERYPALAHAVSQIDPGGDLLKRLTSAWREYSNVRPFEPHRYLAQQSKIKTIVTVNPDDLLRAAFEPVRPVDIHVCDWSQNADLASYGQSNPREAPGMTRIFHLMGHLSDVDSLVITEDHYFQFLAANVRKTVETKNQDLNDDFADMLLRGALASSALVLLGFRITDWDFRTVCHVLLDQNGGKSRKNRTHIAVQVDPEDGIHGNAFRAREYIERLFHEMLGRPLESNVAVYWGSAEDFLEELEAEWKKLGSD